MFLAVQEIMAHAWDRLTAGEAPAISLTRFAVMGLSIVVTLVVGSWERRRGETLGSEVLATDGWRAMVDVLISVSVVLGLMAAQLGVHWADVVVSVGIAAPLAAPQAVPP